MKRDDDMRELQAVLGGARAPDAFTREECVKLVGDCARALLRGELPSLEQRLVVGGGLASWLESDGRSDLVRDHLRLVQRGSHRSPQQIWKLLSTSAHEDKKLTAADDAHVEAQSRKCK